MNRTNAGRLEILFQGALEIPAGEDRDRYLLLECGEDFALRRRVEGLLAAHFAAGRFLDPPASRQKSIAGPRAAVNRLDLGIAGVRILQRAAEGGFSIVYLAEQLKPMRRPVALKILKPGLDLEMGRRRFKAEREALAALDHPNIVRIHEAGTTMEGLPYQLLEWIRGPIVTHYADAARLTLKKRLELFLKICAGMAHAHGWKVVHQDIKPANILVPEYDGAPVPKLIDFGTAVFAGVSAEREWMTAGPGGFVGTPNYMSPEQATGVAGGVDVRADVFSLGVVLYELLTGLMPFDTPPETDAEPELIRRAIQSRQCISPSIRVEQCDLPRMLPLAEQRRKSPFELAAALRGDLDAIVAKTLAADRANRYSSANDLANDIRLHLENRPVPVTNPGWVDRSQKFVRRHAVSLATAALISGILLAAFSATLIQELQSRVLKREAIHNATEARNAKQKQEAMRSQKLVSLGLNAIEHQNAPEAMAWFSQAARLAAPGSQERQLHGQRVLALAASVAMPIRALQHQGPLRLLEFSPEGNQLLALAGNGDCLVWNWQTDKVPEWSQQLGVVTAAQWSPAGTQLALGRETGMVEIRDAASGRIVRRLDFGEKVSAIRFSPDGRELAVAGNALRLWEEPRGDWSPWRWVHPAPVFAIRYSADGNRLVSACADRQARAFFLDRNDPNSSRLLGTFQHQTGVTGFTADHCAAALIPTDPLPPLFFGAQSLLLTWTAMNELTLWGPAENRKVGTLNGTCLATRVRASPNGEWIAVTFPEGSAQLWSPESFPGQVATRLKQRERICDLAFGPDAKWVLTASADRTARLWELPSGKLMLAPLMHSGEVAHGAVSRNGKWVATAQLDGQIRVWRLPRSEDRIKSFTPGFPGRWDAHASPGSGQILLTSQRPSGPPHQAVLFQLNGSDWESSEFDLPGEFVAAAWTLSGNRLAILTRRSETDPSPVLGHLEIRRAEALSAPSQSIELSFMPSNLAADSNGNIFFVGDDQGGVWRADTDAAEPLAPWLARSGKARDRRQDLAFSASGNCLIRCRANGRIEIWDATSRQLRFTREWPKPDASRRWLTPSPNEPQVLITDSDGALRVLNLEDGKLPGKPMRHPGGVIAQGFSPDGRWVVTSGHDRCVRISDWRTGELICPPLVHEDEVFGFDFSTNGNWLATACRNGAFRVWDTKTGASLLADEPVKESLFDVRLLADNQSAVLMGRGSTVWVRSLRVLEEANDWSAGELTLLSETVSGLAVDHDQPSFLGSAGWQDRLARIRTLQPDYFGP